MLLQHAWLAPLVKPETIMEEDEEEGEEAAEAQPTSTADDDGDDEEAFVDREVGEWVIAALERKKNGTMGKKAKPALHAAPLDAVAMGSPVAGKEGVEPVTV